MGDTINLGKSVQGTTVLAPLSGANFNLPNLLRVGIVFLFVALTVGSFLFLLVGAVQWVLAGGDKEGIEKAKKKITNAIIGLAIGFSIYAIMVLIGYITGTDFLNTIALPTL